MLCVFYTIRRVHTYAILYNINMYFIIMHLHYLVTNAHEFLLLNTFERARARSRHNIFICISSVYFSLKKLCKVQLHLQQQRSASSIKRSSHMIALFLCICARVHVCVCVKNIYLSQFTRAFIRNRKLYSEGRICVHKRADTHMRS